jgi:hypothetical protein
VIEFRKYGTGVQGVESSSWQHLVCGGGLCQWPGFRFRHHVGGRSWSSRRGSETLGLCVDSNGRHDFWADHLGISDYHAGGVLGLPPGPAYSSQKKIPTATATADDDLRLAIFPWDSFGPCRTPQPAIPLLNRFGCAVNLSPRTDLQKLLTTNEHEFTRIPLRVES